MVSDVTKACWITPWVCLLLVRGAWAAPPAMMGVLVVADSTPVPLRYTRLLEQARSVADLDAARLPISTLERLGLVALKLQIGEAGGCAVALCDVDCDGQPIHVLKTWGPYHATDADARLTLDFASLVRDVEHITAHDHPFLGLAADPDPEGLKVLQVADDSDAQRAGLRAGDQLEAFDGWRPSSLDELTRRARQRRFGARVPIRYARHGVETDTTVEFTAGTLLQSPADVDDVHARDCYRRAHLELVQYGIVPPADVDYEFVPPSDINGSGRYSHHHVLIAEHLGRYLTVALMAHELTHAWQFATLPHQDKYLVEGFATWIQYHVNQDTGRPDLGQRLMNIPMQDVHAPGLHWLRNLEKQRGLQAVLDYGRTAVEIPGVASDKSAPSDMDGRPDDATHGTPTPTATSPPGY